MARWPIDHRSRTRQLIEQSQTMITRSVIFIWLISACLAWAGLEFEIKDQEIDAPIGAVKVTADFPFTNKTKEEITISKAAPDCSCMGVGIKGGKFTYAPGESGLIRAEFDMGNFTGSVDKQVAVWLKGDPVEKPSIHLKVKVNIPELIELSSKSVKWTVGKEPEPQTIRVEMKDTQPVHITGFTSTSKDYAVEIIEIEKGKTYDIKITPTDWKNPGFTMISLKTDSKITKYKSKQIYASNQREEKEKTSLKP